MKLERIVSSESEQFNEVWQIYEMSFPADERRNLQQQTELLKHNQYQFFAAYDGDKIVGLLATWKFDDFLFMEHFAVREELRNSGTGTKIMKEFLGNVTLAVGEVERPETEMARRRIGFWERQGFKLNRYDYTQPWYSKEKQLVPMFIISYPREISEDEFSSIREKVHKTVYGLETPLM